MMQVGWILHYTDGEWKISKQVTKQVLCSDVKEDTDYFYISFLFDKMKIQGK